MNLNQTKIGKHILLVILTLVSVQLVAVKPSKSKDAIPAKEIRKKLNLKQKVGLFLLKKMARKNDKQAVKKKDPKKNKKLAKSSLWIGIISVALFPITLIVVTYTYAFGILIPVLILMGILSIIAVVLAAKSLKRIKQNPEEYAGKGAATTGLVLGLIVLFFWFIFGLAWLASLGLFRTLYA